MNLELKAFLRENELFSGLTDEQLEIVTRHLNLRKFGRGERIFSRGEEGKAFYVVRSGRVEIFIPDPQSGLDRVVEEVKPHGAFGEVALLTGTSRSASARALEDCELIVFGGKTFVALLEKLPGVGFALSRLLADRLGHHQEQQGISFIQLSRIEADPRIFQKLPKRVITKNKVVPIREDATTVTVAMVNPFDIVALDDISRYFPRQRIVPVAVAEEDFNRFYNKAVSTVLDATERQAGDLLPPPSQPREYKFQFLEEQIEQQTAEEKGLHVSGEQVVHLVNQILGEALDFDASDIHLEPQEDHAVVRYRIDGKLMRRWHPIPIRFYAPLVTRLKVLGKMDITEKRKPQDGRIAIFRNKKEIDFRLSTLPTRFGEKIVMRILDRSSFLVNLNRLIVIDEVYETVRGMVNQPYGILFVAGPTGSGKTTTMYSAIMERKDEGINIVTVEDPVEYSIPGITQVQINEATNLGFSEAIRAFLRQDPDIIMVGETRDPQTARHAMTAALMGHLVFTSLHANDAIGTILRLRDIGIETFLIANAVVGTIYQRLLRRICQVCREPFDYDEDLLGRVRVDAGGETTTPVTYFRGRGCHACNGTGFRGRVAAYEVLRINEELRHLVSIGAETSKIREAARHAGMKSLKSYCQDLLALGLTTPQDVLRILYSDQDW